MNSETFFEIRENVYYENYSGQSYNKETYNHYVQVLHTKYIRAVPIYSEQYTIGQQ